MLLFNVILGTTELTMFPHTLFIVKPLEGPHTPSCPLKNASHPRGTDSLQGQHTELLGHASSSWELVSP